MSALKTSSHNRTLHTFNTRKKSCSVGQIIYEKPYRYPKKKVATCTTTSPALPSQHPNTISSIPPTLSLNTTSSIHPNIPLNASHLAHCVSPTSLSQSPFASLKHSTWRQCAAPFAPLWTFQALGFEHTIRDWNRGCAQTRHVIRGVVALVVAGGLRTGVRGMGRIACD